MPITRPGESCRLYVSERDLEISAMWKARATRTVEPSQLKSRVMKMLIWICSSGRRD